MSGDIQARKRKGKGRKKDEGEDDVTETKAKIIVNDSKHGNNNGKGEGSGVVAKIFFLILLVSLSLVVGLILVELRGKQAAVKESRSAMPDAELYTPEPIEPEVHGEPVPEAPPPVQQEDANEEYEPIEATPPLEEYIKVVEKVVETPQEEQASEDDSFFQAEEADVVEEVVEVVEEIPVEEVVEIVEEVIVVPAAEEEAEPVVEEPSEEIQQEAEEEEEIVQEVVKEEEQDVVQEEVKEDQEEEKDEPVVEEKVEVVKEKEEVAEEKEKIVEKKEEVVEEKEEVVADQDDDATEDIEEVEEPIVAEDVQELDAPVEETSVDDNEDEDNDQDDEEKEVDDDDDDEEEEEEDGDGDGDDDDDDDDSDAELNEEEAEAVQEVLEESIDSLVEDLESLTKAYIRVEALAEDIRSVDPENEMVAQLVPHIAGVLRALESGHTEGLADTLNHIEIILLDIQRRLPVDKPAESPKTPETEAASEPAIGTEPELVVADSEPLSSPEATDESKPAEPQEVETPVVQPPPLVEEEAEPQGVDEPEAAALVSEPVVVESESVVDSSESQVEGIEGSESIEQNVVGEAEHIEEEVEETAEEEPQKEQYVVEEREPLFPLDSSEVLQEVSEEVLADIESQIIPDGEDPSKEAKEEAPVTPPNEKEEDNVVPSPSPEGGDKDPVPVDEVIPDPIHIEPLQKPEQEEASKEPSPAYEKADITSETDSQIREELDEAEKELPRNPGAALNSFGALLHRYPKSARALYGRALSQDRLAEVERSNTWLEKAIATYRSVIDLADEDPAAVPLPLLRMAAEKCIDRLRFRGFMGKAVRVQQRLLQRFPDDIELRNQLGVTFLMMNQATAARDVYKAVLEMRPDDGFAQVHYGFILKTTYDNNTGGIEYMRKGIKSEAEGTQDGRFYFHLGDALQREGHTEEAYKWYDIGVEKGLFLSRYQRSLYNVDRLRSQPLWTLEETTYQEFFRKLEDNWLVIRKEGLEALALPAQDGFRPEAENLHDTGDWKQYELFTRGRKITANCVKAPKTCELVESFQAAAGCKRGQVKFSVMYPGTHVHAHTGPTNCRLRAHLGLVVPDGLRLRVGDNFVNWLEGKVFVFDDSWEHEVWHEGDAPRLILIVDVWHPEITEEEKKSLSPI